MKLERNGEDIMLPDFMIVGAAKSGTTTIYDFLNQHPDIYFPERTKEPHYFSFGGTPPAYLDGQFVQTLYWRTEDYLNLYANAPESTLLGDGSTSYLYQASKVINNMRALYGERMSEVSIIIILRNPIERAYSHYNYLVRNGFENLPFDVAIQQDVIYKRKSQRWGFDYLCYGNYCTGVSLYQQYFKQVKVLFYEDLGDAEKVSTEICSFLGIQVVSQKAFPKRNPSGQPKNRWVTNNLLRNKAMKSAVNVLPASAKRSILVGRDALLSKFLKKTQMSEQSRLFLQQYYRYSILRLENLTGKRLKTWLE